MIIRLQQQWGTALKGCIAFVACVFFTVQEKQRELRSMKPEGSATLKVTWRTSFGPATGTEQLICDWRLELM